MAGIAGAISGVLLDSQYQSRYQSPKGTADLSAPPGVLLMNNGGLVTRRDGGAIYYAGETSCYFKPQQRLDFEKS
jgi:hypothetical protein